MDWYCAIRQAKISLLQETYPDTPLKTVRISVWGGGETWFYLYAHVNFMWLCIDSYLGNSKETISTYCEHVSLCIATDEGLRG